MKMDLISNNNYTHFCSDKASGVSPAEKLSPEHLQLLRNAFTAARRQTHENRRGARNKGGTEKSGFCFEDFREVLRSVIDPNIEDVWIERFFSEVRRDQGWAIHTIRSIPLL